ncbi:hypothetical protein DKX38_003401 [Salix brachista]|uniref:Eukaryotic translation initiation factor 4C n=1 Tax=Salix brachista TaxID=2182728 RepID=A0A5N5NRL1_9ROSI|nr:hypothetical protein DKX38_003401 [Salix brachista]
MPKNKGKGGKNRKRGKNEADDEKRELIFKEDGQEYAQVLRMLGNGRCEAMCIDGTKRLCHIRGKMHKKVWIAAGDIILVGLRDYQDDKADVILKYMPDEARLLKAYGELPENTRLNEARANVSVEYTPGFEVSNNSSAVGTRLIVSSHFLATDSHGHVYNILQTRLTKTLLNALLDPKHEATIVVLMRTRTFPLLVNLSL